MASALATPHTATRPSSLSSSFGLFSSLSFMFVLIWLFWLVLLGFAFCSAFCSSSIFFRNSALLFALSFVSPLSCVAVPYLGNRRMLSSGYSYRCPAAPLATGA